MARVEQGVEIRFHLCFDCGHGRILSHRCFLHTIIIAFAMNSATAREDWKFAT